ncbi:MAG: hypothetical protein LUD14_05225 [Clostridiales bacterium]|nr:hypothetical protein [Clostridiales bacterium]
MLNTRWIVLIITAAVCAALIIFLYFFNKKTDKKRKEQQDAIEAAAQTYTMLIIDKKKMRMQGSGLPQSVIDETPRFARRAKVPIVKVKVGPRIMTMIADNDIFDSIPVKKEVKATVAGIYITDVRGIRGPLATPPKKKKFTDRFKKGEK